MEEILDGTIVKKRYRNPDNKQMFLIEASQGYWKIKCPDGVFIQQENKATTAINLKIAKNKVMEIYGWELEEIS